MSKKKIWIAVIIGVVLCGLLAGCTQADKVSYNISQEADNFNTVRQITVINCIQGDTLFQMTGKMSIYADTADNQLEVTVEDENGTISFEPAKIKDITFNPIEMKNSGYYLLSGSFEKGGFCTVEIDCEASEFDVNKFGVIADDLTDTWLNVSLITGATYYGMDLELNFDSASTRGKSFDQIIMYYDIETEEWSEDISGLEVEKPFECSVIETIAFGDADVILHTYMAIANEEKPLSQIELDDGILLYVSPLIEYLHGREVCLEMWLSDSTHIKSAKNNDLMSEVPSYAMESILSNKPEWLV